MLLKLWSGLCYSGTQSTKSVRASIRALVYVMSVAVLALVLLAFGDSPQGAACGQRSPATQRHQTRGRDHAGEPFVRQRP